MGLAALLSNGDRPVLRRQNALSTSESPPLATDDGTVPEIPMGRHLSDFSQAGGPSMSVRRVRVPLVGQSPAAALAEAASARRPLNSSATVSSPSPVAAPTVNSPRSLQERVSRLASTSASGSSAATSTLITGNRAALRASLTNTTPLPSIQSGGTIQNSSPTRSSGSAATSQSAATGSTPAVTPRNTETTPSSARVPRILSGRAREAAVSVATAASRNADITSAVELYANNTETPRPPQERSTGGTETSTRARPSSRTTMVYSSSQNAGNVTDRSTVAAQRNNSTASSSAANADQSTAVPRNELSGSSAPILTNSNIGSVERRSSGGQAGSSATTLSSPRQPAASVGRPRQNSIARQPVALQQQQTTRRLSNPRNNNNDAARSNPRYVTAPANGQTPVPPAADASVRARPPRPTGVARQTASLTSSRRDSVAGVASVTASNRGSSNSDTRATTLHRARDTSNRLQSTNARLTSNTARHSHVSSIGSESRSRTTSSSGEPGINAGESKPPHQGRSSINRANVSNRARVGGNPRTDNNNNSNSGASNIARPRRRSEILDQINQNDS